MKTRSASFNFVRSYLAIVLGIVLAALLLDALLATTDTEDADAELARVYAPVFALLNRELAGTPAAAITVHVQQIASELKLPLAVIALEDFAGLPQFKIRPGEQSLQLFYDNNDAPMLYQLIPATDLVLALGPLPQPATDSNFETLVISAYYALVALILLMWLRPFYRDLFQLRAAAAEFGKQDFSTRVYLNEKSSILPVAQSFNAMAERIEYLVSAHRELTNAVSHELRTPLARFKFSMEILARTADATKRQQYLDNMKTDVVELEGLIDELLNYAKLSEQNLLTSLVDIDLKSWLQDELAIYAHETIRVSSSFSVQPVSADFRCSLNPELMARAIHNIIRNGLRYARTEINVHTQIKTDSLSIRICDDGPGIPLAMQEKIFEPFSRLETSRDKASGGYGLGLAIAARILERHQGKTGVTNCEPHGACFVLAWPRKRVLAPQGH